VINAYIDSKVNELEQALKRANEKTAEAMSKAT